MRPEPVLWRADLLGALHDAGSWVRRWPERARAREAAGRLRLAEVGEPRLHYGWGATGAAGFSKRPIGGEIKLLHLQKRFPFSPEEANLFYLVSSALPPQVEFLVQRGQELGLKLVWNQNGVAYPGCYGDSYAWFNRRMRKLLALADYVIYQSEFSQRSAARYLGLPEVPGEVRLNPVDVSVFRPAEGEREPGRWRLLAAGTSHAWYRTRSALETLRVLRKRGCPAELILAGEFRWKGAQEQVREGMRGLEEWVKILPPFTQAEAPEIYRRAEVLLHTKDKDPCPTVPIEAMASGLPVVGLASGGMPELVPEEAGCLVEVEESWTEDVAGSPEDLADAVEQVMAQREVMSRSAREHAVRTFAVEGWIERHAEVFEGILRGGVGR
jgi:glycosyltransferase involved in cell wall biosynthesis